MKENEIKNELNIDTFVVCNYAKRPYGFQVVLESTHGPGILDLKTVVTNVRVGYNPETGFFTTRTDRTFVFTWNIESFNESVLVALEVNGEEKSSTLTKQMYYQATVKVRLPSSTLKKMIMCI